MGNEYKQTEAQYRMFYNLYIYILRFCVIISTQDIGQQNTAIRGDKKDAEGPIIQQITTITTTKKMQKCLSSTNTTI